MTVKEHLRPLEFLLGEWTSESISPTGEPVHRKITYEWIHDGNFLRGTSSRTVGDAVMSELTVLYLWDPVEKLIRSWVLSGDGIWSRAIVEVESDTISLFSKGVTADGKVLTLVSVLSIGESARTEHWTKIRLGGVRLDDAPIIEWRKNPGT